MRNLKIQLTVGSTTRDVTIQVSDEFSDIMVADELWEAAIRELELHGVDLPDDPDTPDDGYDYGADDLAR